MEIILENIPTTLTKKLLEIRTDLVFISDNGQLDLIPDFNSIILGEFNSSGPLKHQFSRDFKFFNKLLLQIHYKRKMVLSDKERLNLLQYLSIGYLISNDVRYFNEFLWFYKPKDRFKDLKEIVFHNFKNNLDENNTHSIPYFPKDKIRGYIATLNDQAEKHKEVTINAKLSVGLIGIPFIFKNVYPKLVNTGHTVSVFMVPYYTELKRRLFLKSGLIFKAFTKLKGVKFPYKVLNYDHRDKKIKELLSKEKLDVGFFKLGFIVKDNIYDAFNIGLLHDHLAVLPFVRGRSSIEFSLLTGVPVGSTIHFIGRGIDTGGIVKIYTYDVQKGDDINSIRKKIKKDFENRIYDSLEKVSTNSNDNILNDTSKGLTYYSIHPELYNFINRSILN
jgi:folate-dependent phosphoribosylglycinamide formyltransferase PurN